MTIFSPRKHFRTPENVVVIGITGGIASGKSTASKYFEEKWNAALLNADHFGHEAYKPGTECLDKLVEHFGERILNKEDGTVDRKVLGGIVFSDPKEMEHLNRIVWPAIHDLLRNKMFEEASKMSDDGLNIIVVEAAVMVEANWMDLVDEVWVLTADIEIAKTRLMKRNQLSEEDALARIHSQISNEERTKVANVTVSNNGDEADLVNALSVKAEELKIRYSKLSAFEVVDIVDMQDQVIGTAKRACVRAFNLVHRCSYIVLEHEKDQKFFVQRRSNLKDSGPGLLDPAPGGVVEAGESYLANAQRELVEEMGLVNVNLSHLGAVYFEDAKERFWGALFYAKVSIDPEDMQLQPEEVQSVQLMTKEEILALPEEEFLPCGLYAFKKYFELSKK